MTIRSATDADEAVLRELWEEFEREVPLEVEEPESWDDEWKDTRDDIATMRRIGAISFGSCSFEEPIADLKEMGWL